MGEMTVWGRMSSCNVQKVIWVLEELGLDYEHIELGGKFGGNDDPSYLAMNPNGRVPTIKDRDLILWESDAIVRYLAARYGSGTLWPEDPVERAPVEQWMTWGTTELLVDWIALFWRLVRTPEEKRRPEIIARHHKLTCNRMVMLDRHLAGHDYMVGDTLTMADVPAGMTLYRWYEMEIERPITLNIDAWYARLCERPAYRKGICVPFDDLVGRQSF